LKAGPPKKSKPNAQWEKEVTPPRRTISPPAPIPSPEVEEREEAFPDGKSNEGSVLQDKQDEEKEEEDRQERPMDQGDESQELGGQGGRVTEDKGKGKGQGLDDLEEGEPLSDEARDAWEKNGTLPAERPAGIKKHKWITACVSARYP
jgi:hypothetical protein